MPKKELLEIAIEENVAIDPSAPTATAKRVLLYGWDYANNVARRLPVTPTGSETVTADNLGTAVRYGQQTSSGSPVALAASQTLKNGLIVSALSGNSVSVFIGDASVTPSTGYELQAGQATSLAISDPSLVYVTGSGTVCWVSTA